MYLGIDLGTCEVKTLLMNEAGTIVGTSGVALEVPRPHPLWAEQDPNVWWSATDRAIRRLCSVSAGFLGPGLIV
jgi:xylulokinase